MNPNTSNNGEHKKLIKKDLDTSFDFLEKCRSGSYRIKNEYFWALKNVIWTLHKSKKYEQGYAKALKDAEKKIVNSISSRGGIDAEELLKEVAKLERV